MAMRSASSIWSMRSSARHPDAPLAHGRLFYGAKGASLDLFLPDKDLSIDDLLKRLSFEQCGEWTGSFYRQFALS
jgi:hypothetical protein